MVKGVQVEETLLSLHDTHVNIGIVVLPNVLTRQIPIFSRLKEVRATELTFQHCRVLVEPQT